MPSAQDMATILQNLSPQDRDYIIRTVYGEAGGESPQGQQAVADVILNRARESGMSPEQVVTAKGQFEPWATRASALMGLDPNSPQYQAIATNLAPTLSGDAPDATGGADYFYAPGAQAAMGRNTPSWAQGQQGTDIGNQRFYSLGYGGGSPGSNAVPLAPGGDVAPSSSPPAADPASWDTTTSADTQGPALDALLAALKKKQQDQQQQASWQPPQLTSPGINLSPLPTIRV